jgi:hypothetical protein
MLASYGNVLELPCVGFLLNSLVTDFSSCPMMNIMSAHDIISNEEVPPTFQDMIAIVLGMHKLFAKVGN